MKKFLLVAVGVLTASSGVRAASYTWDTSVAPGFLGAAGVWNATNTNWSLSSGDGTTPGAWVNGSDAAIGPFSGNITIGSDALTAGEITVDTASNANIGLIGTLSNLSFTQLTVIKTVSGGNGKLNLVNVTTAAGGVIILDSGTTLYATGATINQDITVSGAGNSEVLGALRLENSTVNGDVTLAGNTTISSNTNTSSEIKGDVTQSTPSIVTKRSVSTLTLSGAANAFSGLLLQGGTLNINGATAVGTSNFDTIGVVVMNINAAFSNAGRTILSQNSTGADATVNIGSGGTWTQTGNAFYVGNNRSDLSATIGIGAGGVLEYAPTGASDFVLGRDGAKGTINVAGGELRTSGIVQGDTGASFGLAPAATKAEIHFAGGTFKALSAGAGIAGMTAATLDAGGATFDSNGFAFTVAQAFSGVGKLTKSGAGTLTLSGANTFSGGTRVSAGALIVASTGGLTLSGATGIEIASGQSLTVAGTLRLTTQADKIANDGTLTFAGATIDIGSVFDSGYGGADYTLITGSGGYSGSATVTGYDNAVWSDVVYANGALVFTAVPEPEIYGLLGAGLLAGMAFVKRRRRKAV